MVSALNGGLFDWRDSGAQDVGLIAQEVEAVLPEAVSEGTEGYKSVDYARLVPVLVEGIKQQQAQIEALQAQLP